MHAAARATTFALALKIALVACLTAAAQRPAPPQTLPDWSGWWGHRVSLSEEWRLTPPPLKAEIRAAFDEAARAGDAGGAPLRRCGPMQFTGSSGGFTEAVEFLFTPGRVTLTNEMGLIRRIYTDGRALPMEFVPTNTGTSVGRWEGQTLVVYTAGINPQALYPSSEQPAVPIGQNARISERIFLTDPNTLQFDIVTTAPGIFTAPDRRTRVYSRLAAKKTANEITHCTDDPPTAPASSPPN